VVDSDDEADFSHMDGKAGSGRSRTDFATDEEWQARARGRVGVTGEPQPWSTAAPRLGRAGPRWEPQPRPRGARQAAARCRRLCSPAWPPAARAEHAATRGTARIGQYFSALAQGVRAWHWLN